MSIFSGKNKLILALVISLALWLPSGCVYYNTFYNAKKAFNEAEKSRQSSRVRGGRVKSAQYDTAIEKSLKVIENYPNTKYYDDALYILGVSYYQTGKFISAERRLRELLANYPESKYVKEAELYLAKVKLERQDEEEAMVVFEKIFRADYDRTYKAEAATALGDYHFIEGEWNEAIPYYMALRDSLGTESERKAAQIVIADSYFNAFKFNEAMKAYLQVLGMKPDNNEKYHALFGAAMSSFRLMRMTTGLEYLQTLAADQAYFDSLGVLNLRMAEAYENEDNISLAEDLYAEILQQETNKKVASEAAYRLGLIYQFDYDDLPKAKEYYDEAVKLDRSSAIGRDALERSSDIGKIEKFRRTEKLDSLTTQEMIDEAAFTQYQLAELYWVNLNKLDSAIIEMQYVVDSFPTSKYAPKAMIALSHMYKEQENDPYKAYDLLREITSRYPGSDYIPEALEAMGLAGSKMDTGYAAIYIKRAEYFVVDEENIDSARYYYQYVVDNFPQSKYYVQAKFALVWLMETYDNPGDSTVYYAYADLISLHPDDVWAEQAETRISKTSGGLPGSGKKRESDRDKIEGKDERLYDTTGLDEEQRPDDTSKAIDPLVSVYIDPNGEKITNVPIEPTEIREPFVYPVEAYRLGWEGDLYFQIFLDFSGEVVDYILKIRSESEEINREASKAVESMIFDPLRIPQEQQDAWMVYKFQIRKPDYVR